MVLIPANYSGHSVPLDRVSKAYQPLVLVRRNVGEHPAKLCVLASREL